MDKFADIDTVWMILLIGSEIGISFLVLWGLFRFFNKNKVREDKHRKEVDSWKK